MIGGIVLLVWLALCAMVLFGIRGWGRRLPEFELPKRATRSDPYRSAAEVVPMAWVKPSGCQDGPCYDPSCQEHMGDVCGEGACYNPECCGQWPDPGSGIDVKK